jgi:hypothetical protein
LSAICLTGLITRIYNELKNSNTKTTNNPINNLAKELNRQFLKEEVQIVNKNMKKFNILNHKENVYQIGHQWLIPVILVTQEGDIRKTMAQRQLWRIVCETRSQKFPTQERVGGVS